jgi:hypothetical protein
MTPEQHQMTPSNQHNDINIINKVESKDQLYKKVESKDQLYKKVESKDQLYKKVEI